MSSRLSRRGEKQIAETIGQSLRASRHRLGLVQEEVGQRAGLSTEVYGRYERGRQLPSVPMLVALYTALRAEPNEVLGFSPPAEPRAPGRVIASLAASLPDTHESRLLLRALTKATPAQMRLLRQVLQQFTP